MGATKYEVTFDNNLLTQILGLSILSVDHYRLPERTLADFLLAREDKRKVNSAFLTERHINVWCYLTQNSRDLLDIRMDELKTLIQGIEKSLIVPHGTGRRQFTATLSEFNIEEITGGTVWFRLDFLCSDNFGYDLAFTSLVVATGRTLYNYTDSFNIDGSAPWQTPVIKVTFTALTGGSNADVVVVNPATGQTITVNRTWAAGDVLAIDSQNTTVTVNGTAVAYSGAFPEWQKGTGYLQIYDNFLTRTKTVFVYYFKRWA